MPRNRGGLLIVLALVRCALEAAGTDTDSATIRVAALAGLEQGNAGGGGAAIAVLAGAVGRRPADLTIPWAVIPFPGILIAAGPRNGLRGRPGWRHALRILLGSIT